MSVKTRLRNDLLFVEPDVKLYSVTYLFTYVSDEMVSVCMCVNYQELKLARESGEKLGISVQGGVGSRCGNPFDSTDEGIFISQVISFKY